MEPAVRRALATTPAVALLGPRQVGKTTLALELAEHIGRSFVHLDLERDSDLNRLAEAELYFSAQDATSAPPAACTAFRRATVIPSATTPKRSPSPIWSAC